MAALSPAEASQRHSTMLSGPQVAIPIDVAPHEVARKYTLGGAIELCAEIGGKEPKEVQAELRMDKAQWSRWVGGQEGIVWQKLSAVMDLCGNDAPVLWMNHARGWHLYAMRRRESETERENRMLREENAALKRVLMGSPR